MKGVPAPPLTTFVLVFICCLSLPGWGDDLLFYDSFEEEEWKKWVLQFCPEPSMSAGIPRVSTAVDMIDAEGVDAREGRRAARFYLHSSDCSSFGGPRAEIAVPGGFGYIGDSEWWFGASLFLPDNNPISTNNFIISQWHGRISRGVPLAVVLANEDILVVLSHGLTVKMPLELGVWIDFVWHVIWTNDRFGLYELWIDGRQIVELHNVPTLAALVEEPVGSVYWKLGLYGGKMKEGTSATVYWDSIRIASSAGSYDDVAPRQRDGDRADEGVAERKSDF